MALLLRFCWLSRTVRGGPIPRNSHGSSSVRRRPKALRAVLPAWSFGNGRRRILRNAAVRRLLNRVIGRWAEGYREIEKVVAAVLAAIL